MQQGYPIPVACKQERQNPFGTTLSQEPQQNHEHNPIPNKIQRELDSQDAGNGMQFSIKR